jgi:chitinase
MKIQIILAFCILGLASAAGPKFAPYYDTFLNGRTDLRELSTKTGQKDFHLAFALGGHAGCKPTWGATYEIDDPIVLDPIREIQAQGGQMIIAFGGAMGPYLEHVCQTPEALAQAYITVIDTVGSNLVDVDVETTVSLDLMNRALAMVQQQRPAVSITFTLMVQGEDYGLTPGTLGVELLKHAKANGVRVDVVNAMAMEYPKISPDFGDSVINVGLAVIEQLKVIYPEKSETEIRKMIGITPMIGRNFNGQKFELAHATKLVNWANQYQIGLLAFWSIERDNGGCSEIVSPTCSGLPQPEFEFTKIFQGFR